MTNYFLYKRSHRQFCDR